MQVTDAEVARVIVAYAERSATTPKQFAKMMRDSPLVNRISTQLLISKTVELIKNAATVEEIEPSEANATLAAESSGSDATPAA